MPFFEISELAEKQMLPGFTARMIHAGAMTISYWEVKAGSSLPDHIPSARTDHDDPGGTFTMTSAAEEEDLQAGPRGRHPSHMPHSALSQTDCGPRCFSPFGKNYK